MWLGHIEKWLVFGGTLVLFGESLQVSIENGWMLWEKFHSDSGYFSAGTRHVLLLELHTSILTMLIAKVCSVSVGIA